MSARYEQREREREQNKVGIEFVLVCRQAHVGPSSLVDGSWFGMDYTVDKPSNSALAGVPVGPPVEHGYRTGIALRYHPLAIITTVMASK